MTIKNYGDEIAFKIDKPRGVGTQAIAGAVQDAFDVLDALHTQTIDALPEDHPLVGVLSEAIDAALQSCPGIRVT